MYPESKVLARLARKSLKHFSQQAWDVLEPTTPLEWNWHLDAVCLHVQAVLGDWMDVMEARRGNRPPPAQRIQNLILNVPPGSGKSRFVSVFTPAWMWLRCPSWRAIFVSGNPRVSLRDADYCRTLIESDWYRDTFRPDWALARDQNAKSLYRNTAGGYRMAISAGSRVTGDRGDALFVDDPNDADEVGSEAYRDAINHWWDQGAGNRVNDLRCSVRLLIMQRLHEQDLTGHILAKDKNTRQWHNLVIRQEMEAEDVGRRSVIGWVDPRPAAGELMFPSRFPPEVLAAEQLRLGPSGYAGQHQQRPTPAGGGRFKSKYFRYWQDHGLFYRLVGGGTEKVVQKGDCWRFACMDPAGVEKKQNNKPCYTVVQAWDVTPDADMILVDQYREQVETPEAADAAVDFCRRHKPDWLGIESNGLGLGVVQTVQRKGVAVLEIVATTNKEARSETAEIRMAAGKVYFPENAAFLAGLEKELALFPNGEYADQVDVLSHAARLVQERAGPPKNDADAKHEESLGPAPDTGGMFAYEM